MNRTTISGNCMIYRLPKNLSRSYENFALSPLTTDTSHWPTFQSLASGRIPYTGFIKGEGYAYTYFGSIPPVHQQRVNSRSTQFWVWIGQTIEKLGDMGSVSAPREQYGVDSLANKVGSKTIDKFDSIKNLEYLYNEQGECFDTLYLKTSIKRFQKQQGHQNIKRRMGKTRQTMVKLFGFIFIFCIYSCNSNQFDNKHVEYYDEHRVKSVEFWNDSDEERELYQFNEEGDTTVISKTIGNHQGIARFYNDTTLYTFSLTNSDYVYEFLLCVGGKVVKNESLYALLQKKNDGINLELLGHGWDRFDLVLYDLADSRLVHGDTLKFASNSIFVPNNLIKGKRLLGLPTKIIQSSKNGSYSVRVYEIYLNISFKQQFQDFFDIQKHF